MMSPRASAVSLLLVIFAATLSNAFDISKILSNASDFSSFNDLLNQTGLAQKINGQQTITVLALNGGAVGSIQGKPKDELQRILSNHVILDYYDMEKLKKAVSSKSTTLTTMFQKSGQAQSGLGFLNATKTSSGDVMLGSGVKNAPLVAKVMKQVAAQPYNISVLQISQAIVAPGIDNIDSSSSAPTNAPAPSPKKKKGAHDAPPAPSPDEKTTVNKSDSPAPSPGKEHTGDEASGASRALAIRAAAVAALMGLVFVGF